jgi:hypothetical protein
MIIQTFWKDIKMFSKDNVGAMAPGAIIGLMIALIFLAYLMPVGLDALAGVNDTAWTTAEKTLFGLVGLFAVIGVVSKIAGGD